MFQSFEACMYTWCKISSIHRGAEVLLLHPLHSCQCHVQQPEADSGHPPFSRCLDSRHTTWQFSPSTINATVDIAKMQEHPELCCSGHQEAEENLYFRLEPSSTCKMTVNTAINRIIQRFAVLDIKKLKQLMFFFDAETTRHSTPSQIGDC